MTKDEKAERLRQKTKGWRKKWTDTKARIREEQNGCKNILQSNKT